MNIYSMRKWMKRRLSRRKTSDSSVKKSEKNQKLNNPLPTLLINGVPLSLDDLDSGVIARNEEDAQIEEMRKLIQLSS